MRRGNMPFIQLYKGSYRVRRPIPKHLVGFINRDRFPHGGVAYMTQSLRRKGEPKLRDRAEANRRALPYITAMQAVIDKANGNHDIVYGELEQTTIKDPTHTYRLRDPSDPTSLEIVSTVMVERFVKKADLKPVEPTTPTITYEFLIEKWADENYKGKKTRKTTNTNCARFVAWLGHDDPTRVTLTDCIRYKDFLVDARKAGKMADQTIKNQLITLRSVFKYASDNNHLGEGKTNPMVGVKFTAGKGKEIREYSLEERRTILIAACGQKPVVKWLTWLSHHPSVFRDDGLTG